MRNVIKAHYQAPTSTTFIQFFVQFITSLSSTIFFHIFFFVIFFCNFFLCDFVCIFFSCFWIINCAAIGKLLFFPPCIRGIVCRTFYSAACRLCRSRHFGCEAAPTFERSSFLDGPSSVEFASAICPCSNCLLTRANYLCPCSSRFCTTTLLSRHFADIRDSKSQFRLLFFQFVHPFLILIRTFSPMILSVLHSEKIKTKVDILLVQFLHLLF